MNKFDVARQAMGLITRDHGPIDGADTRPGAYTVYAGLLGLGGGGAGAACTNGSGNPIADAAKAEMDKGVHETPDNSNRNTDIDEYTGGTAKPWSPDFVSWVYNKANSPFTGGATEDWRLGSVAAISGWLQANGQYTTRQDNSFEPQAGDVIIIAQNGTAADHVGIIYAITTNSSITTIEGNVRGAVVSKTYSTYTANARIIGWGRK